MTTTSTQRSTTAPTTDAIQPAPCPAWYQPIAWPAKPARNEPAMPSTALLMKPISTAPG